MAAHAAGLSQRKWIPRSSAALDAEHTTRDRASVRSGLQARRYPFAANLSNGAAEPHAQELQFACFGLALLPTGRHQLLLETAFARLLKEDPESRVLDFDSLQPLKPPQ
jgi:hypothetical protein